MKTGVLGGTFDPVHNGHIVLAEETAAQLNLDEVLFVPAGQPWLKVDMPVLAAEHRLRMVSLAIAGKPNFRLSTVEIERAGPSYTVDTIAALRAQSAAGDELFFIMGRDSLAQLHLWKEAARLVEMCRLVAVPRPGYGLPDLDSLEAAVPGLSRSLILLEKPEMDISASDIRERISWGLSVSHLVPEPVERYIREHNLYLSS